MEDKDKLQICWQAFSMENSLLQSYRMLFMMVEAALLALGFMLLELYEGAWIWAPATCGWAAAIIWGIICHYKGKDVNKWRNRILELKPKIARDWFDYLKLKVPKDWFKHPTQWPKYLWVQFQGGGIARYIFNYIIPGLLFLLWVFMVVRAALG